MKTFKLFWRINENIRSPEVRVIGADGKQLGVMKIAEALEAAKKQGLTLVEIAPGAKPPVTKIVDFGKFRYQEEKKLRREAKKAKTAELKEVRFSPFIAENDYQTRFGKVKDFLGEKNKVRLVVVFRGPQMRSKKFGYDLLGRMLKELGDTVVTDMQPKFLGKHLMMIVSPTTKRPTKVVSENKEPNHAKTTNQKSLTKRFRITKHGKVMRRQAFRRHLKVGKSKKRLRNLKKVIELKGHMAKKIKIMLGK